MKKTVQDMNIEIQSLKKTQTWVKLEIKDVGSQTNTLEVSLKNRIQEMEERISAIKENIGKNGYLNLKKCKILTNSGRKHPENLGHCEKIQIYE